jgi:hypothetical protein
LPRFPVAFRPPAFASQVIRPSLGDWAFLAVGLPDTLLCPDPIGVPTFHTHEMRPGWVPPVSRGRRCSSGRQKIPDRRLPLLNGQPLFPAWTHRRGSRITRHQRRFTRFTRPVCPLPVTPWMVQGSSGFPPELRTPPLPATHAEGGARPLSTCLRLRTRHSGRSPFCESTRYVRPRVAAFS